MAKLTAIIMAAGHGTRMKSTLPKVLHEAAGRPIVYYPVRAALDAGADRVVVVVNPATREPIIEALRAELPEQQLEFAVQEVPRGTGDAVRAGLTALDCEADERILILSGDTPLLIGADLKPLVTALAAGDVLSFLAFWPANPRGYGRVKRDRQNAPLAIVEERDLVSDEDKAIREVNAGMYCVRFGALGSALAGLSNSNAQGEYYLTDLVAALAPHGSISAISASSEAASGVNHRGELSEAEEILHQRIRRRWAAEGVTVVGRPCIDDAVEISTDVHVEDGARLRGKTSIGARTFIDVGVVIDDCEIGADCHIKPYSVLSRSVVGDKAQLGPFAHLRPGSVLEDEVHVGNFVETKQALLRRGAKANHLSYLGDAEVGEKANIGAGTIVCNYDGFRKQRTHIGARAFIGSDSHLIAPVSIGDDAYVATGTTVTRDVPPGALAVGRARQENKLDYAEPLRERLRAQAAAHKSK
jgi:bifunctional UDP-N-acetylglucosamine pyrophosphorylase/glucosamine-1-phosphate N-acetyltransferase